MKPTVKQQDFIKELLIEKKNEDKPKTFKYIGETFFQSR